MIPLRNQNYHPPYDSPLEDLFALNLDKYLADQVRVRKQVEVKTFCGGYRLDFVASLDGHPSVAFECDGIEFHDESRDEWRDAMILDSTELHAIYRFKGPALFYHMEDCLYLLSRWENHLFDSRGHTNLRRLASQTAIVAGKQPDFTGELLQYPKNDDCSGPFLTKIERHVLKAPLGRRSFLKYIAEYGRNSKLADLDEIRAQYRQGMNVENEI